MESIGLKAILEDSNFQAGLKRYQSGIGQMEKSTEHAASVLSRVGAVAQGALVAGLGAATISIGAFVAASKVGLDTTLQWSEGLDKMGDMFGISGEKASGFQFLANKVGVSIDEMGVGLNTFTRGLDDMKNAQGGATMVTAKGADAIQSLKERLEDANTKLARAKQNLAEAKKPTDSMRYAVQDAQKAVARLNADLGDATKLVPKAGDKLSPFAEALKKLGVRAYDAKGKLRTFDSLLPEVMDKFEKLPPGINASALAMDLFGARGGSKFLDFLRQGSKGLTEAQKKAKLFGLELSTEEVNAAEEFGFAMNELNLGIKGFWNQIGRQVLPIARRFVDFLNVKIIPAIAKLAGDWIPRIGRGLEYLADLIGDFASSGGDLDLLAYAFYEVFSIDVSGFVSALRGVAGAVGEIANAFKSGGLAGGLQAIGTQITNAFKNVDWTAVSKSLDGMKAKFWTWLTGEGGVLSQVGTELGKVVTAIASWLGNPANTQPIVDAVIGKDGLVTRFWEWLTDPTKGAIVLVTEKMAALVEEIAQWAREEKTKRDLERIGEAVARSIIDGIFSYNSNSKNVTPAGEALGRSLATIPGNIRSILSDIGGSIASGLIQGIISYKIPPSTIEQIRGALNSWMTAAVRAFVLGDSSRLVQMIIDAILGKAPAPTPPGGSGSSGFNPPAPTTNNWNTQPKPAGWYAEGGPVRRTGLAMVHAGEYVLNRQQAMAWAPALASTSTVYNFNHTWPAAVPPSQREWTESMVRRVTQQEVRGILGKG